MKKNKSISSGERQELILKKMKAKVIQVGSGVSNENYDNKELYEFIHVANWFQELTDEN